MVYGAVAFIWVFMPVYLTIIGSLGTDIVNGTCVPWKVYSSRAAEMAKISSFVVITYLFPLAMMVFCYSRIVCVLRNKVSYAVVIVCNS